MANGFPYRSSKRLSDMGSAIWAQRFGITEIQPDLQGTIEE